MTRSAVYLVLGSILAIPVSASAEWTLNNTASTLSFITIKAQDVAEVNSFSQLSGSVGNDGHARIVIQLGSVDTLIPIRDERMREILFQTELFPTASVTTRVDLAAIQDLTPGRSMTLNAELLLNLQDRSVPVTAELLVARLADDRMLITTAKPLLVTAAALGLTEGVARLREIAGLPSISQAVPVTFILTFDDHGSGQ